MCQAIIIIYNRFFFPKYIAMSEGDNLTLVERKGNLSKRMEEIIFAFLVFAA